MTVLFLKFYFYELSFNGVLQVIPQNLNAQFIPTKGRRIS